MDCKAKATPEPKIKPRLIIHGGAGNITPANLPSERYREYRNSLLSIVRLHSISRVAFLQPLVSSRPSNRLTFL